MAIGPASSRDLSEFAVFGAPLTGLSHRVVGLPQDVASESSLLQRHRLRPRLIVLGVLMACFAWAVIIPWSLTAPPTALLRTLYMVGLTGFGAALLWVLWCSVSPDLTSGPKWFGAALLVTVSLALWAPAHLWAELAQRPWAWVAGFAIAASALLGWRMAAAAAGILAAATLVGGQVFHASLAVGVPITLTTAAAVWVMCQALVWMLRLLWEAQAGRAAQADLVIAQERLRLSRELHDVLGHRLSIIALKAELAENDEIRTLAADTLRDARQAVHDQLTTNLPSQLHTAELVLSSAGIRVSIDAPQDVINRASQARSELMAAVAREAVTNLLRHSAATQVAISLTTEGPHLRLTIANDGVSRRWESSDGTGLAGLAARCATQGASMSIVQNESWFELCVRCSADAAGSR